MRFSVRPRGYSQSPSYIGSLSLRFWTVNTTWCTSLIDGTHQNAQTTNKANRDSYCKAGLLNPVRLVYHTYTSAQYAYRKTPDKRIRTERQTANGCPFMTRKNDLSISTTTGHNQPQRPKALHGIGLGIHFARSGWPGKGPLTKKL